MQEAGIDWRFCKISKLLSWCMELDYFLNFEEVQRWYQNLEAWSTDKKDYGRSQNTTIYRWW